MCGGCESCKREELEAYRAQYRLVREAFLKMRPDYTRYRFDDDVREYLTAWESELTPVNWVKGAQAIYRTEMSEFEEEFGQDEPVGSGPPRIDD